MAGFEIVDTYKAYKVREKKVTTWLKETAAKFGFRGTAKTESGSDLIRISEIPAAVKLIVSNGESIPENLHQLLRDVISQRKEASIFYKSNPNGKGDEGGHAHYLSVLEEALRTFEGKRKKNKVDDSSREAAPGHSKSDVEFNNLFDLLGLEEATTSRRKSTNEVATTFDENSDDDGSEENQPSSSTKRSKKTKSGKRKGKGKTRKPNTQTDIVQRSTPTDAELELVASQARQAREWDVEDEEDELYFMIYCFFKDFNYMREYIQERWCDYADGLLSLAAVSVTTNTAFELLQRSERELLSQIPPSAGLANYQSMASLLFFEKGLAHVDYDEKQVMFDGDNSGMNEAIFEEADYICLPTYWVLSEWLKFSPPRKIPTLGHFIGTTPDYRAQDSKGRMERDRQILQEMLAECCLIKAFKNGPVEFMIPGEDELTIGWTTMLATRKVPIWLIFASQIFCDIRWILESDVSKCHEELQRMGKRVDYILSTYINFAKDFTIPINSVIYTTVREVECWITSDFAEPSRSKLYRDHGHPDSAVEQYAYLRRDSLLCGLMIFRFSLTMNELGLGNSNQWGAIIASAHLYNAVHHELPSFPQWLDMEALIVIHTTKRIFWRDDRPSTLVEYSRCYDRATGVGEMVKQRQAGTTRDLMPTRIHERGIGPIPGVSAEYWNRVCFGRVRQLYTLPDVEKVLNSIAEDEMQHSLEGLRLLGSSTERLMPPEEAPITSLGQERALALRSPQRPSNHALTRQFLRTHALTNVQLLDVLCTRISQESYALNFDYFALHERCTVLLKAVYEEFKKEIIERDDELDWGMGDLPVLPYWLFEMLQDEEMKGEVLGRLEKVMAPMIEKEGSHEVASVREFVASGTKVGNGRPLLGTN